MTRFSLVARILFVASLVFFAGCADEPATQPSSPPPAKKVSAPPPKQTAAVEVVEEPPPPPPYRYVPEGKRDPFVPPTIAPRRVGRDETVPLTPLQKVDLNQLRLIAVLVGKGEPRAMVEAPGGKSYILKRGTKVGKNDGVVKEINNEAVVVEERYIDFTGNTISNLLLISLPKRAGVE